MVCNESFRQQPETIYSVMAMMLLALVLSIVISKTVVDVRAGVTHRNHEDTITTPLPGNCGCGYPDCGGCDHKPQITLEPTVVFTHIPDFGGTPAPATPDIPDPIQNPTIFPTFDIPDNLLPTPIQTMVLPTIIPTLQPPTIPTSNITLGN